MDILELWFLAPVLILAIVIGNALYFRYKSLQPAATARSTGAKTVSLPVIGMGPQGHWFARPQADANVTSERTHMLTRA